MSWIFILFAFSQRKTCNAQKKSHQNQFWRPALSIVELFLVEGPIFIFRYEKFVKTRRENFWLFTSVSWALIGQIISVLTENQCSLSGEKIARALILLVEIWAPSFITENLFQNKVRPVQRPCRQLTDKPKPSRRFWDKHVHWRNKWNNMW